MTDRITIGDSRLATTGRATPPGPDRRFIVQRKAIGATVVIAETVEFNSGGLIFRTNGSLVVAFSPHSWSTLEEAESE